MMGNPILNRECRNIWNPSSFTFNYLLTKNMRCDTCPNRPYVRTRDIESHKRKHKNMDLEIEMKVNIIRRRLNITNDSTAESCVNGLPVEEPANIPDLEYGMTDDDNFDPVPASGIAYMDINAATELENLYESDSGSDSDIILERSTILDPEYSRYMTDSESDIESDADIQDSNYAKNQLIKYSEMAVKGDPEELSAIRDCNLETLDDKKSFEFHALMEKLNLKRFQKEEIIRWINENYNDTHHNQSKPFYAYSLHHYMITNSSVN